MESTGRQARRGIKKDASFRGCPLLESDIVIDIRPKLKGYQDPSFTFIFNSGVYNLVHEKWNKWRY